MIGEAGSSVLSTYLWPGFGRALFVGVARRMAVLRALALHAVNPHSANHESI